MRQPSQSKTKLRPKMNTEFNDGLSAVSHTTLRTHESQEVKIERMMRGKHIAAALNQQEGKDLPIDAVPPLIEDGVTPLTSFERAHKFNEIYSAADKATREKMAEAKTAADKKLKEDLEELAALRAAAAAKTETPKL